MENMENRNAAKERTEDVLERVGIPVSSDKTRDRLQEHIQVHKFFMEREQGGEADWNTVVDSWSDSVARPLKEAIGRDEVKTSFPSMNDEELFFQVSDHWYFLKQERGDANPHEAASDFASSFGNPVTRFLGTTVAKPLVLGLRPSSASAEVIERPVVDFRKTIESELAESQPKSN